AAAALALRAIVRAAIRRLGPLVPQQSGRRQRALERAEPPLELSFLCREELDEIDGSGGIPLTTDLREPAERALVAAGRPEDCDRRARFDPELVNERSLGVTGRDPSPFPLPRPLTAPVTSLASCCLL